jgi:NAD(P)-dependent dehydrogenase (short-subunit alcohol dehydrogenase family)
MMERIALITGGNRGIGLELARQLARAGVKVIITARQDERGRQAVAQLADEGLTVDFIPMDVTNDHAVAQAAKAVTARYGRLDMLINNAGVFCNPEETALSVTPESLIQVMDTNTFGPLRVTQWMAPLLRLSGNARVINISSGMGQLCEMDNAYPAYAVSKTALNAITRILAAELRPNGVTVNAVCPGWVRTDMGGPDATRSPEDAVAGILPLLLDEDERRTGQFLRDGKSIPW